MGRQQKRYQFLAVADEDAPNWETMRHKIEVGPHGTRQVNSGKSDKPTGETSSKISSTAFSLSTIRQEKKDFKQVPGYFVFSLSNLIDHRGQG